MPAENPRLDGRGLVVTGFVDSAGDPVGIVAADGSFHRGEVLVSDALRALTYTVTGGRTQVKPPGVTFPAHWHAAAADALRRALASLPEWSAAPKPLTLISDAAAALTALQAEPGLPTRGVVALCDFGGSGTNITLADAADGYRPIGATVRHAEFSGDLVDRALLAHLIADLSIAGTADLAGTAAIGSLHRLREQCRGAKERLSRGAATTLPADVPGFRGDIRLTRSELDEEIRQPITAFIEVLRELLFRNRIHSADLAAVASVGGGANIPALTTALSEQLRVPVITTIHPELTAARGAALRAVRGPQDENLTAVASLAQPGTLRALAWSEVDDVSDIPSIAPYSDASIGLRAARPQIHFAPEEPTRTATVGEPWYRPIPLTVAVFAAMVLVGTGAIMALRNDAAAMTGTTTPPDHRRRSRPTTSAPSTSNPHPRRTNLRHPRRLTTPRPPEIFPTSANNFASGGSAWRGIPCLDQARLRRRCAADAAITANRRSITATGIKPLTCRFKIRPDKKHGSPAPERPNPGTGSRVRSAQLKKKKAPKMKKFGLATIVAGGMAASILGLAAPAAAAPTGPGNAQDTISELQADGYNVIVNRVGASPLDQATVVAVRPGQTYSRTDSGVPGAGNDVVTTVTNKTVYVDVR